MRPYLIITCTALALLQSGAFAFAEDDKGKNCRMEQQCRWENFKKICVYVKVCR